MRVFPTMAWIRYERVYLLVHAPGIPLDEDWSEFIKDVTSVILPAIVVVAGGAKLTPKQRVDVQKWFDGNGVRGAVVTDSAVSRGVVTALAWFGVKIRAFASRDMEKALEFAGITAAQRQSAKMTLERLERALLEKRSAIGLDSGPSAR